MKLPTCPYPQQIETLLIADFFKKTSLIKQAHFLKRESSKLISPPINQSQYADLFPDKSDVHKYFWYDLQRAPNCAAIRP